MPYIGRSTDGFGVRNRFLYLASADDTSVSGADANGATLSFSDGAYVDVYLNGVLLKAGTDYNTNTANTIAGLSAMAANDEVTVIVYDIFAVADTVSQSSGGTFSGNVTMGGTLAVTGASTLTGNVALGGTLDMNGAELILDADADTSITSDTDDRIDFKTAGSDRMKINSNGSVGIGTATTTGDLNISPVVGSYTTIQMTSGGATTGNIIYFGDSTDADYSSITSFGSNAGENGRIRFIAGTKESLNILNNGTVTVTDGDLKIGTSGHGIDFSANTQSAVSGVGNQSELLDFYEEGTWTPVPYGASTSGSVTSGSLTGHYTRIGRIVHVEARADAVVLSSANGSYYIDGLPFTVGGTGYNSGSVSMYKVDFDPNTFVEINGSGTTCYFLVSRDATTWTTLDQSAFGSQHYWFFTLIYTV